MIIPIKREDGSLKEWVIVELQGDLKHSTDDITNGQFIGDLHFSTDGSPILIIGIHVLYGKEMTLQKPYAVLEKIRTHEEKKDENNVKRNDPDNSTEYFIKAVVRKKLIFRGRPKPIVTDIPICI